MSEQELKQRFFAQYYGQFVLQFKNDSSLHKCIDWFKWDNSILILKNIESITDEDCLNVSVNSIFTTISGHKNVVLTRFNNNMLTIPEIDLLRSKSYLIPFMNLSVEEIIKKGWAKYE